LNTLTVWRGDKIDVLINQSYQSIRVSNFRSDGNCQVLGHPVYCRVRYTTCRPMHKTEAVKFISMFDAKSGYWQIPVAKEDRWLTAFVTHDGLYEWVRMPFGLKNAGATFVRAVRIVLQPIRDFSESYVDDVGVGSTCWSDHWSHLRQFLSVICNNGMTLNLAKCHFAQPDVKFVGIYWIWNL